MSNHLNKMADDVYSVSTLKGWHEHDAGKSETEIVAAFVANIHAEASELWEAYRAGKLRAPCDKAAKMESLGMPALTCIEEELADLIIRVLDGSKALGVDIGRAVEAKHAFNATRPQRHGGKLA